MARIVFLAGQQAWTGGIADIEVDAANFRDVVAAILQRFPSFPQQELWGCAVAIDGEIVSKPLLEPLSASSVLILMRRIAAG
ncbi:MAG: hypothetical protein KBG75_04345 [Pseudomonadales bacterium]|nr:hypothetical protein [Pseudomonadales bacterium]